MLITLVATFELFLIRRYIELHAQWLMVSIFCFRVRVLHGSQLEPLNDVERFLSMIRFDSREKLKDLPLE